MAHIRLGELLVRTGHLSEESLERALAEQKKWGGRLGRILREMNLVTEEILLKALTKQLGLPRADLSAPSIPPVLLSKIDAQFAVDNRLCPERFDPQARTLMVAVEDHLNLDALDELAAKTGARVKTSLGTAAEIDRGLTKLFPGHPAVMPAKSAVGKDGGRAMAMFETKDFSKAAADARGDVGQQSTVRMLDTEDFSNAAGQVKDETAQKSGTMRYFGTDDFTDDAKNVREDED